MNGQEEHMKKVLIVGGLGAVGQCALEHFESKPDWQIVGVSRRKPPFPTRAEWVSVDLRDRADCDAKLSGLRGITHIAYTAVYEKPHVTNGWSEMDHVETNLAMLQNCVEVVERASPELKHITIMQGTKAYGGHLGPFRQPARESDARYMGPNFYYNQMDWLADRQLGKTWSWTILRPQIVCGIALGSPLNIVSAIGVYAAISREYGMPLRFPGGAPTMVEAVDADLLGEAIQWCGDEPRCGNEIFNVSNGDCFAWRNFWPRVADLFSMPVGLDYEVPLVRVMADKGEVWKRITERHALQPLSLNEVVPSWGFADFIFRQGNRAGSTLMSTIKIRQAGFTSCRDTEDMFIDKLRELQELKILPR